jgi:hypothetical protein
VHLLAVLVALVAALPPPVDVRPEPQGVELGDPAFEALPGARADFGRLGGSVYQIEVPARWNGRLVLFMHGFGELAPEARVSPPGIRRYLIGQGYAWGASSFSSTALIPGRAADETAALWDLFARRYGRPRRSYVTGVSMGGGATHVAAERYGNRFDGALGLCGQASQTSGAAITTEFFAAAAYVAGVTQREFDRSDDVNRLIDTRILPALRRPRAHRRFEDIMVALTGGRRAFDRLGFRMEEETNWERAGWTVAARIASNERTVYRLGAPSRVSTKEFNRAVIRMRPNRQLRRDFLAGSETTGRLQMPLLTLHTTGDGQVPLEEARIYRRKVESAGRQGRLVQRVFRDAGHCGFRSTEWAAGLEALRSWVERGRRPRGGLGFELAPRPGTPEADRVPGARRRITLHGDLRLDGRSFDSRFLGAVVLRPSGLVTPCQLTLSSVSSGRAAISVVADAEASGCGVPGARVALWAFAQDRIIYSRETWRWPRRRSLRVRGSFATATPAGAVPPSTGFNGGVFRPDGRQLPNGTRVEAYIGSTLCGVASVRYTGSFAGYILGVVGPEAIPGCTRGGTITFRVNGRPAVDTAVNDPESSGTLDLTVRR